MSDLPRGMKVYATVFYAALVALGVFVERSDGQPWSAVAITVGASAVFAAIFLMFVWRDD